MTKYTNDGGNPRYRPCNQCSEYSILQADDLKGLIARDYGMILMSQVSFSDIDSKPGSPAGWFNHVIESIAADQSVNDPIGLARTERGLEIINGHHRVWTAIEHSINCPAVIFAPVCGVCTEALFLDSINEWTRAKGWMYHQQGFKSAPRVWL